MKVHEDFTSKKLTLVFDTGNKVELTKAEGIEFERWFIQKGDRLRDFKQPAT